VGGPSKKTNSFAFAPFARGAFSATDFSKIPWPFQKSKTFSSSLGKLNSPSKKSGRENAGIFAPGAFFFFIGFRGMSKRYQKIGYFSKNDVAENREMS
jgi:hypothetical protein